MYRLNESHCFVKVELFSHFLNIQKMLKESSLTNRNSVQKVE